MSFKFEFTEGHLAQLIKGNPNVAEWYKALCKFLPEYEIDTQPRVAAFIAQCAHESGSFKFLKENLNYSAEALMKTWPSRFPSMDVANQYARQPEKIANKVYSSRMGNGDEASGDGARYIGQGLIQLTGKDNQSRFAASIGKPLEEMEKYLGTYDGAVHSACWFWKTNGLNAMADAGDVLAMTKRINGGTIGLEDRKKHYAHALEVLGGEAPVYVAPAAGAVNISETVRRGSKGSTVAAIQAKLGLTADGDFGPGTEAAVKKWQAENGLAADGIAGPMTLGKLLG